MLKKIAIGLAIVVVIIAAGAYYGWSHLDLVVRAEIEKYGSAATQTEVKVDRVKLSPTSGEGSLSGLSVANPKGFSSAKAFDLGSISMAIDIGSIRGPGPIVIRQIIIDKPQVSFELSNSGNTNLQTLQHNVQAYSAASGDNGGKTGGSAGSGPGRKIIVDDLTIRNGQITISQESLQGRKLSTPLPTIHLTDIGKNSGGATAAQVAEQVIDGISSAAAKAALGELTKEKLSGVLQAVPGAAIGGAAVNAVGSELKGVFGK